MLIMAHNDPSTPRHHLSFKLRCNANKQPIYFPQAKTIIPDPITSRATAIFTGSGISSGILDLLVLRLDAPQASSRSSTTTPSVGAEKGTKVVDANSWRVGALPASPSSSLARKGGRRAHSLFLSSPRSRLPTVSLRPLCSQDLVRFSLSLSFSLGAKWVAWPPKFFRLYTLGSCYGTWECSQAYGSRPHHVKTRVATNRVWRA